MGPVEALVQPLGAAWAGALLVGCLAFRRRAWLAGFTALGLAGGLWLVGTVGGVVSRGGVGERDRCARFSR